MAQRYTNPTAARIQPGPPSSTTHARRPSQSQSQAPQYTPTARPTPGQAPPPVDLRERQVNTIPPPASQPPTDNQFFYPGTRTINYEFLQDHFFKEGRLTEQQALYILDTTTALLSREPNVLAVASPVTICGDIHGQYYDLMKLFDVGGHVRNTTYLFLGDYVDRGSFGIECLLYLYVLKLNFPQTVSLLRGNHECQHLTEYFTFKRECLHKYSQRVYDACIKSFCALPLAAIVDGRFFCVHGGISPELITLDDLRRLNRFQEPGSHGLLCDLLWSDPINKFGHEQEEGVPPGTTFLNNAARGCSYFYTYEAACQFLDRNNLLGIIRGHEAQDSGYCMYRKTPTKKFPSVITIFSAPNYLDVYRNRGAVIKYANKNITIRQYNSSSHPYWLPNFMDAFTWSLPYVGSKITEMLLAVLAVCSEEELADSDTDDGADSTSGGARAAEEIALRRQEIKNKILAVGKMQRVFQLLREEAENASELEAGNMMMPGGFESLGSVGGGGGPGGLGPAGGGMSIGERIKRDALGVQGNHLRQTIRSFDDAKRSDILNERLPTWDPSASSSSLMFPVPSMRLPGFAHGAQGTGGAGGGMGGEGGPNMEYLIRRTLEEEDDGGVVERLAEKIARGRSATGRPRALKRYETAY